MKKFLLSTAAMFAVAASVSGPVAAQNSTSPQNAAKTATPIKHLVVIFSENVSFDHYFGTYPYATNPSGEPVFKAAANTPAANNLVTNPTLLSYNGNSSTALNGTAAANPFRIDRSQANTKSQSHAYVNEQYAYDNGRADLFPKYTGAGTAGTAGAFGTNGQVMGYFDGNTVTAMWNYAQHYAMSDNSYADNYGPSSPGAINVVSGQTNGAVPVVGPAILTIPDGQGGYTMYNDIDPGNDVCSSTSITVSMTGKNIGDLLNAANLTWGGFMGGFNLQTVNTNGTTSCVRSSFSSIINNSTADYVPHHAWFQYYPSTANPTHARPSSTAAIGYTKAGDGSADPANHQYDLDDFYASVTAGNFPSVSYIKMQAYQDAHPGNSDPLDEQAGVVKLINFLQQQPDWQNTAVIINYDDSDGWYDHAYAAPTSASSSSFDHLNGTGKCGSGPLPLGVNGKPVQGRCGPGPRIPFIVVSPFAKQNYISHVRITQSSVVRFIEDNWLNGGRLGGGSNDATAGSINDLFDFTKAARTDILMLDPTTGTSVSN